MLEHLVGGSWSPAPPATAAAHSRSVARRQPYWHPPRTLGGSVCPSLNDLGDLEQDLVGEGDPKRLGGLQVHHEVKGHRLLDREISGFRPIEDAVDIVGGAAVTRQQTGPVGHEPPPP